MFYEAKRYSNAATMFFKGIYDSCDKDDKENV